jgi:hypothetical protein
MSVSPEDYAGLPEVNPTYYSDSYSKTGGSYPGNLIYERLREHVEETVKFLSREIYDLSQKNHSLIEKTVSYENFLKLVFGPKLGSEIISAVGENALQSPGLTDGKYTYDTYQDIVVGPDKNSLQNLTQRVIEWIKPLRENRPFGSEADLAKSSGEYKCERKIQLED